MLERVRRSVLAVVACLAGAGVVRADPVLWIDDGSNRLGKVDVATNTVTVVGTMVPSLGGTFTDIAFDPSGQLWGITFTDLYKIDKNTAGTTHVGTFGGSYNSLTFAGDGTLYTVSNGGSLYTLNTSNGAATLIGGVGFGSSGDLAFHNGTLFLSAAGATDDLVSVNTGTGAGTLIGSMGVSGVYGLANASNNILYGVAGTTVYSVNTGTGATTSLFDYSGQGLAGANGTAFFTEAGAVVPVPSAALGAFALGGGGLLVRALRRRRA